MLSGMEEEAYQLNSWGSFPQLANPGTRRSETRSQTPFRVSGSGGHLWCKGSTPRETISPLPLQMVWG